MGIVLGRRRCWDGVRSGVEIEGGVCVMLGDEAEAMVAIKMGLGLIRGCWGWK